MKLKNNVKGITLIALVVTIIVLLILAGIALNLTIGENGLFTRAQNAANTWQLAEQNEQNAMNDLSSWMDENIPKGPESISETESYVGYYADTDGDGTVDGVIYADLAVGGSGEWNTVYGKYEIPTETNLKQYYIEEENYDGVFGTGKVIARMEGTDGNDRFYVMALENINSETRYYWYFNAHGNINKTVSFSDNDFGQGRANTEYVMEKWNDPSLTWGKHNDLDMWGAIEDEIDAGWFVPSKSEWGAFGKNVLDMQKIIITGDNCEEYGFSGNGYWSSSASNEENAYFVELIGKNINSGSVRETFCVRLSTTF